ncbi:MAG: hypothetical protein KJ649_08935 [Proteobacteria bacterium]|nr:hypothetical protein [Pseudomonadota bacterium]
MLTVLLIVPLVASAAKAEYIKTGPVIGHETHGFIVKLHDQHKIAAVEKDGQLYEFKDVWDKVDKYNEAKGICTLYTKNKAGTASGAIASGINALKEPVLLEQTEKGYRRVDADYVTFPCIRR